MRNLFLTVTTIVVSAISFTVSAQQLTYGTYLKNNHNIIKGAVEPYFAEVAKKTDNALSFRLLADSMVVGANTTSKGVQQGLVTMGTIVPFYTSSVYPMTGLFTSMPMFQTDSLLETAVVNELFFLNCERCQSEWISSKVVPLAFYASSPYYLQCTSEIQSIEDLKGKRIQGTGEYAALVTAFGGLPLALTAAELYTGMSQGTIDCVTGAASWLDTYGLKDVVKHVINMPLGVFRPVGLMNMNINKWNGLSDAQRHVFIDGLPKLVADAAYGYVEEDQIARQNGLAAHIKFSEPFDGFVATFDAVSAEGGERFVELARKNGMQNPEHFLARYLELENEWREIIATINSEEEYEQALRERIFSKVQWVH